MSFVNIDDMSILINTVEYGTYVNSINVSGGTPMYEYKPLWNGRKVRAVTGYNEWVIDMTILLDSNTKTLINAFTTTTTSYTISIGQSGVVYRTFSNLYISDFNDTMTSDDGLQMVKVQFIGEGLSSNRV